MPDGASLIRPTGSVFVGLISEAPSGTPLHPLAHALVQRQRRLLGEQLLVVGGELP